VLEIEVDRDLCQGHAQCQDAAPEVFEVRDDGLAHLLITSTDDARLIAAVEDAAKRCPVEAIRLTRTA
jgi:ferredoxin